MEEELWLIHTAQDYDWDRDREMMGFYITLCTVHTIQRQGQVQGIIVFHCTHPVPCPWPCPAPVPCSVYKPLELGFGLRLGLGLKGSSCGNGGEQGQGQD